MTRGLLSEIVASKVKEIARCAAVRPLADLQSRIEQSPRPRGFINALESDMGKGRAAVIAEIKKASPSAGIIRADFAPATLARSFAEHHATCLSVLTDAQYFQGQARYITEVREVCHLPVLRKDFIIDPYQIFESRVLGADAVLLIVAALGDPTMRELAELAHTLDLDVLLEVHNHEELERALALPCRLLGINNRNLQTFETHLHTTLELLDAVTDDRIVVTESGIRKREDVLLMQQHAVHAFLVGETLMRAPLPGKKLKQLFGL